MLLLSGVHAIWWGLPGGKDPQTALRLRMKELAMMRVR